MKLNNKEIIRLYKIYENDNLQCDVMLSLKGFAQHEKILNFYYNKYSRNDKLKNILNDSIS